MRAYSTGRAVSSFALALALALAISGAMSCASRYRTHLYCIKNQKKIEAKVEEAFYVRGYGLRPELSDDFLIAADGQLAAVAFFLRDTSLIPYDPYRVVQYRPRRNYRLFWPLPVKLARGSLRTPGPRPFVRDMDNYEAPPGERVYTLAHGDMLIDSIKSSDLYTSISAAFYNQAGDSLHFEGQVKIRRRKIFKFSGVSRSPLE